MTDDERELRRLLPGGVLPDPCPHETEGCIGVCADCMAAHMRVLAHESANGDAEREAQLLAIFDKVREMGQEVGPDTDLVEASHRLAETVVDMGLLDGFSTEVLEEAYCAAVEHIEWPDGVEEPS